MSETPILEVKNLSHVYSVGTPFEHKALDNVNLSVSRGEFVALLGHTGSGKSTLIQHLNGLLRPTSGSVLFNGKDIFQNKSGLRSVRFRIGLLFQYPEYQLFGETVEEDVAFGPGNMGLDNYEINRRVESALRMVGLSADIASRSPFELSGGQKRRVAIAGVLAMEPEVLILDEPTAGLDPRAHDEILELIRRLHRKRGTTILLVTHSMDDAARMADRLCVMKQGRLFLSGAPQEIFQHTEELEASGLALPQVTQVMQELRRRGIDIDSACYTVEQAAQAILAYRKGDPLC
jgi:energy-coupling factor transport system ATP-binding protein